ncbi:MAM and LDL-receptor class A domain-containing protein 1-like isoform X2 [Lytechinus pictus]
MEDHTGNQDGGGRFLWSDSNDGNNGQKATIAIPPFNLTDDQGLLTFWYHLYGDGRLEIIVCQGGETALTLDGDKRNQWHQRNMTVSCGDLPLQITFTSIRNSNKADVGIDDIFIYNLPQATTNSASTDVPTTPVMPVSSSSPTSNQVLTTAPGISVATSDELTTGTGMAIPSSSSMSPIPRKGSSPVLPISLSAAGLLLIAAVILLVCFIRNRHRQPEKPISQESIHRYDNHAYSTGMDGLNQSTRDARRDTNSTFDSSTWRSTASTLNNPDVNGTLSGSQPPNGSSHASRTSRSAVPGDEEDAETRHYFVLNPDRASMLVENEENGGSMSPRDPEALYDNKPERYTYIDNDTSSVAMTTSNSHGVGLEDNGYDPVTVKDDITGGYQYVDDTGTAVANDASKRGDLSSPYETVTITELSPQSKSRNTKSSERKVPVPATRKNIPPKPKERMVDNILYKPMNGEIRVDNVIYNPVQDDR